MDKIGILTGGGDAPGLNAVIRAVVRTAILEYQSEVVGLRHGFEGILNPEGVVPLSLKDVRGLLPRGGTILGAANRGNPFARRRLRDGVEVIEDISDQVVDEIERLGLEALIVVGGDGTLKIARELYAKGCPVIGVPKTIDNDLGGTDITFGFDTAVSIATEALDRLHSTAEAHHRVMVLELMGRDAGFIALYAGLAAGADVILIPEIPFLPSSIAERIRERVDIGMHFSILAVAEGAFPRDGDQIIAIKGDEVSAPRLGGIGDEVGRYVTDELGYECRVTVLGHLQRGGTPTAFDRWLATRYGSAAVHLAAQAERGKMVALHNMNVTNISLDEALTAPKRVDPEGDAVRTARSLGISMGD